MSIYKVDITWDCTLHYFMLFIYSYKALVSPSSAPLLKVFEDSAAK